MKREEITPALAAKLMETAIAQREKAYVPYSHFRVGAALLAEDGTVYTGCNIENSTYGAANCAERTAFFKAVSEGERKFAAICIAGGPEGSNPIPCPPCGICRQVMSEFCGPDFPLILVQSSTDYRIVTLGELLPEAFTLQGTEG